jgi:hypothetical protein
LGATAAPFAAVLSAGRPDIDAFEAAMIREKRTIGFFVTFDYSEDALQEISAFFTRSGIMIKPLTVKDILDEHIARKPWSSPSYLLVPCWGAAVL